MWFIYMVRINSNSVNYNPKHKSLNMGWRVYTIWHISNPEYILTKVPLPAGLPLNIEVFIEPVLICPEKFVGFDGL